MYIQACLLAICLFNVVDANFIAKAWANALRMTMFEQEVEDVNAVHRIDNHLVRRLIVMPLTEEFNPNQASEMHNKIEYGDKCSLPASLGTLIFGKPYEVPWLFEMQPVGRAKTIGDVLNNEKVMNEGHHSDSEKEEEDDSESDEGEERSPAPVKVLDKAYISPLDFRSPENYIFIPKWLMKTLGLKPRDLVDISFVRINLAGLVVFQPCSLEWDELMESSDQDPKTILEHEINKYSSLTAGSTIYIEYRGTTYPLYVSETRSELGVPVRGVRVQDSDVQVDIDRELLDDLLEGQEDIEEGEGAVDAVATDAERVSASLEEREINEDEDEGDEDGKEDGEEEEEDEDEDEDEEEDEDEDVDEDDEDEDEDEDDEDEDEDEEEEE